MGGGEGSSRRRGEDREGRMREVIVHPGPVSGWSWHVARAQLI